MALHIHLDPVLYVGRGHAQPDGAAQQQPFELVFSVFVLGAGRARVFGAHGTLDRGTVRNLASALRNLGVHTVLVQRHGIEREICIDPQRDRASLSILTEALSEALS